jgi:hypothetical protein
MILLDLLSAVIDNPCSTSEKPYSSQHQRCIKSPRSMLNGCTRCSRYQHLSIPSRRRKGRLSTRDRRPAHPVDPFPSFPHHPTQSNPTDHPARSRGPTAGHRPLRSKAYDGRRLLVTIFKLINLGGQVVMTLPFQIPVALLFNSGNGGAGRQRRWFKSGPRQVNILFAFFWFIDLIFASAWLRAVFCSILTQKKCDQRDRSSTNTV